ncbi:TPA: hypothetical protein ACH3X1_002753 [Trebouxia sp. C0004]
MLSSSRRRGRAPANTSDVLGMFRLVYCGAGATQPLADDASCVADLPKNRSGSYYSTRNWRNLPPSSQTKFVYLRKWKKWVDDHPEQPFDKNWRNLPPSSQTKFVYLRKWKKWVDDHPEQPEGYLVFPSSITACQAGIPDEGVEFPSQPYIAARNLILAALSAP